MIFFQNLFQIYLEKVIILFIYDKGFNMDRKFLHHILNLYSQKLQSSN